ncbi:hypothetical protein [Aquabacterium sp.]|uniref:hypothetical protein n=1 Tax=Aquabacterium sp. TaxID=1872578 RepID=UPI002CA214F8|nr:hypothetical protein [Aquabacterium sp.]HSW06361.1 hypothetical protein [Aquabacterium sp.]
MFELPAVDTKRVAALALHGLRDEDRLWVLERLAPNEREQMSELVAELTALGVPADPQLLDAALRGDEPTLAAGTQLPADQPGVWRAGAVSSGPTLAEIGARLLHESDLVVAVCLGAYDAAEITTLLRTAAPEREQAIRALWRPLPERAIALRQTIRSINVERAAVPVTAAEVRIDV